MSDSVFDKPLNLDYSESCPEINSAEFMKVITSRRSVRVFLDEKVPDAVMEQVLDAGLLAPSSSNLQTWQFYWIKDPAIKKKMDEACFGQPAASTAPAMVVVVARTDNWKKHSQQMIELFKQPSEFKTPQAVINYYTKLVPIVYHQGWFSIIGWIRRLIFFTVGFFRPVPRYPLTVAQLREWSVKSAALAAENIMLAFRAFGFDSCPMEGFDEVRVKKALGLSSGAHIVMVIGAGKRAPKGVYGPRIRFPKEQMIFIK